MNAPSPAADWIGSNQRLLVAEFAQLKQRLAAADDPCAGAELDAVRAALPRPAAIDILAETFGLSAFERGLLLLAAGVEMDASLAALCGEAQGQKQRPWATFGLASAVLPDPHWSALAPTRPLRRWRLLELDAAGGLASARLGIDERVLHFLAGLDYFDPRLEPMLRLIPEPELMSGTHAALCNAVAARLAGVDAPLRLIQLNGADADGCEDVAAACAARLGLRLHAVAGDAVQSSSSELAGLVALLEREAALGATALLIECGESPPAPAAQLAERLRGVVFLATPRHIRLRRPSLVFDVDYPDRAEQLQLWQQALGASALTHACELATVAGQFRFSARSIGETAANIETANEAGHTGLWRACRGVAPTRLADLARRIEPSFGWNDLVLPEAQKQTLAQIAVHMRHRLTVYDRWGFGGKGSRGLGVSALFAGESGTGKTMAAEVLARELRLELFRVDLAGVVSKYIGETEKNLRQLFDAAEGTGAMLLFDEADALFGKRSEVKDSHDRYANIEVSYLLQQMEAFRGLSILTTNQKSALDSAFMRRLRFVVQFPFPEAAEREALWRRAFPAAAPTADLAYQKLARLQVSGGHIQNIALAAAFLAADAGEAVGMSHVLRAAHAESAKRQRALADAEIRGWA